jgi:hypothetical protein
MSVSFTAHDLQTLRLLSRTPFVFSTPSNSKTVFFRFVLGGEPLNSATRRQLRQSIQNFPKKLSILSSCVTVVRYGAPEFKSRFFRHVSVISLKEIRKGQIFFVDVTVNFRTSPSSSEVQQFIDEINELFNKKTGFSLNQNKSDFGPSIRLVFVTIPALAGSSEQTSHVFRPSSGVLALNVQKAEVSLVSAVSDSVRTPVSVFTGFPKIIVAKIANSRINPSHSILNLLSYRISQLQKG